MIVTTAMINRISRTIKNRSVWVRVSSFFWCVFRNTILGLTLGLIYIPVSLLPLSPLGDCWFWLGVVPCKSPMGFEDGAYKGVVTGGRLTFGEVTGGIMGAAMGIEEVTGVIWLIGPSSATGIKSSNGWLLYGSSTNARGSAGCTNLIKIVSLASVYFHVHYPKRQQLVYRGTQMRTYSQWYWNCIVLHPSSGCETDLRRPLHQTRAEQ